MNIKLQNILNEITSEVLNEQEIYKVDPRTNTVTDTVSGKTYSMEYAMKNGMINSGGVGSGAPGTDGDHGQPIDSDPGQSPTGGVGSGAPGTDGDHGQYGLLNQMGNYWDTMSGPQKALAIGAPAALAAGAGVLALRKKLRDTRARG